MVNTHLGLLAREQAGQVDALLGPDWLETAGEAVILLGDFNATSGSAPYRRVTERLRDAQRLTPGRSIPTFPSMFPMLRIDHLFVGSQVEVRRVWSATSPLARTASDHLPLIMEFSLRPPSSSAVSRSR